MLEKNRYDMMDFSARPASVLKTPNKAFEFMDSNTLDGQANLFCSPLTNSENDRINANVIQEIKSVRFSTQSDMGCQTEKVAGGRHSSTRAVSIDIFSPIRIETDTNSIHSTPHSPVSEEEPEHELKRCDTSPSKVSVTTRPGPSCVAVRDAVLALYRSDDFERVEFLGEGFFSDVYKVRHKSTGECMVLKKGKDEQSALSCSLDQSFLSPILSSNRHRHKSSVLREVQLMNRLRHINVLRFKGVCVDHAPPAWNLHALTEYCNAGSLSRLILDLEKTLSWKLRTSLSLDLATGMEYVHSMGYLHRDLTSMNVLLSRNRHGMLRALVADFGLSARIPKPSDPALIQVGTPFWMAPECLKEERYDEKADVFSYGVILCQIIARIDADPEKGFPRTPVFGLDYVQFSKQCPEDTPTELLRLAFSCCLMNPTCRPSFHFVVKQAMIVQQTLRRHLRMLRHDSVMAGSNLSPKCASSLSRSLSDAGVSVTLRINRGNKSMSTETNESPDLDSFESVEGEQKRPSWLLATSIAAEDPFYEPFGEGNPFAEYPKYRSGRKIQPPPSPRRFVPQFLSLDESTPSYEKHESPESLIVSPDQYPQQSTPLKRPESLGPNFTGSYRACRLRRSASLPSSPLLIPNEAAYNNSDLVGPTPAKERREMQGRMTLTFRDKDKEFTFKRYPGRRSTFGASNSADDAQAPDDAPTPEEKLAPIRYSTRRSTVDTVITVSEDGTEPVVEGALTPEEAPTPDSQSTTVLCTGQSQKKCVIL